MSSWPTPHGECFSRLQEQLRRESHDSSLLVSDLRENPVCSVTLDHAAHLVLVRWRQYATHAQLCFVHESILQLVAKHRICKLLGDDTALPLVPSEDQSWIVENWMPRAIAAGLRFIANKTPNAYFGKLSIDAIRTMTPQGLEFRSFRSVTDARRWLTNLSSC